MSTDTIYYISVMYSRKDKDQVNHPVLRKGY